MWNTEVFWDCFGTVLTLFSTVGGLHGRLTGFRLSLGPVLLSYGPVLLSLGPVLLSYGPVLLSLGPVLMTFLDLPHASVTSVSQIPVSVIISCKTVRNSVVENTALSQMRSGSQ